MIDASGRAQISAALSGGVDLSKISLRKSAIGEGARKNLYSERNGEPDHLQPTGECKLGWAGLCVFTPTVLRLPTVLTGSGIESKHLHTASGQQFSLNFGAKFTMQLIDWGLWVFGDSAPHRRWQRLG